MDWKFSGLGNNLITPPWVLEDQMEEARDAAREKELKKQGGERAERELQAIAERRAKRQQREFWTRIINW